MEVDVQKVANRMLGRIVSHKSKWRLVEEPGLQHDYIKAMLMALASSKFNGERAHRWLGWTQAAFLNADVMTLEDMKKLNKECSC